MTFSSNRKPYFTASASLDPGLRQFVLLSLFTVAMLALCLAACTYNVIPTLEEAAKSKWTALQNQYQQRLDLIPNLVTTVQGHAEQKNNTLDAVTDARDTAISANIDASRLTDPAKMHLFEQAQRQLSAALSSLLAVGENDPGLKSNQNFLALESQLQGVEKRISAAHAGYVEASRRYNIALEVFPTLLWAKTLYAGTLPLAEFTVIDATEIAPPAKL